MYESMTSRNELLEIISILKQTAGNIYIQTHNHPDPDSVATAFGLQSLLKHYGISSVICYSGELSKANMKKMIEIFKIKMVPITQLPKIDSQTDILLLVDCQSQGGNVNQLDIHTVLCMDHHELLERSYCFSDIRSELGACSTIICEYFLENQIRIPRNVAGALLYGINIDTNNLTRGVSSLDIDMFYTLINLVDPKDIVKLNLSQLQIDDLQFYSEGLANVEKYDKIGFTHIQDCNDALLGTIGDIILTVDDILICVLYSLRSDGVKFSIRSCSEEIPANKLIEHIVDGIGFGGGHREMAGGFIPRDNLSILGNRNIGTYIKYKTIGFADALAIS